MKQFITIVFILSCINAAQAQLPQITLQHNGNATFYTTATAAMNAAQNGDTLYFPGGSFGNIDITKQVVIYGTGIHPDSTSATGISDFSSFYFRQGSSGSKVQGIRAYHLSFSPTVAANLKNIEIMRCHFIPITSSSSSLWNIWKIKVEDNVDTLQNITFSENIIDGNYQGIYGAVEYGSAVIYDNVVFQKNIIDNPIKGSRNTYFFNNIFLGDMNSTFNVKNSYFLNNYFFTSPTLTDPTKVESCVFNNNLFQSGSLPSSSNLYNSLLNNIDENYSNTFISVGFGIFGNDYHLKPLSAGNNAGFDGTDIGIYGTASPTRAGWMPDNPHIMLKSIANMPNSGGFLPVQVKVRAVDNQ